MASTSDGRDLHRRLHGRRPTLDEVRSEEFTAEELEGASGLERGRALFAASRGNRSAREALRSIGEHVDEDDGGDAA